MNHAKPLAIGAAIAALMAQTAHADRAAFARAAGKEAATAGASGGGRMIAHVAESARPARIVGDAGGHWTGHASWSDYHAAGSTSAGRSGFVDVTRSTIDIGLPPNPFVSGRSTSEVSTIVTTKIPHSPRALTAPVQHELVSTAKPSLGQSALARTTDEARLMEEVRRSPDTIKGVKRLDLNKDPRFHAQDGWQKMHVNRKIDGENVGVRYQYNALLHKVADVKGVSRLPNRLGSATPTRLGVSRRGDTVQLPGALTGAFNGAAK